MRATEPRVHRHHQEQIDIRENFLNGAERSGWIERHPGLDAAFFDGMHRAMEVRTGFHMDRQVVGARLCELRDEGVRVGHHQVDVEGKLRHLAEGLHKVTKLRSEEHTSELQSRFDLVCRLLLEKKKKKIKCTM